MKHVYKVIIYLLNVFRNVILPHNDQTIKTNRNKIQLNKQQHKLDMES